MLAVTEALLTKLLLLVESASNVEDRGLALARYGISLAQVGQIENALNVQRQLRTNGDYSVLPRVSILTILLDGVVLYYSDRSGRSLDRVRRANLLSKSLQFPDLEAESAVWLAHLAFNFDDYELFGIALKVAFENLSILPDELCGRICLGAADANQYLGHRDISNEWYSVSRLFAQRAHDHGGMVAIEYNRLGMGLSRIRLESCLIASGISDHHRHWLVEMASIERLHYGFGINALSELLLLCESRVRELEKDFSGALKVLTEIHDRSAAQKCGMSPQLLQLEMQWCQAMSDGFNIDFSSNLIALDEVSNLSDDEKLVALSLIKDIMRKVEIKLDEAKLEEMREQAVSRCNESIVAIQKSLDVAALDLMVARNEFSRRASFV
jgi:hypothetical protein